MKTNDNNGILTVVSGFSGSGKGTVMKLLLSKYADYSLSVSVTTRSPRPGEVDGREYFFRTKEEFEKLIADGELLEYAKYVDNYYGTPCFYVEEQLRAGRDVILEIEMQGAMQVKQRFPEAVLVFVTPPSMKELEIRLKGRGTETDEVIAGRLRQAAAEAEVMRQYDYILINENDRAEECADQLHTIIRCEHLRASRNDTFIESLRQATMKGASDQ